MNISDIINVTITMVLVVIEGSLDADANTFEISLPTTDSDILIASINGQAAMLAQAALKLFWEIMFYTVPNVLDSRIEVHVETTTHDGFYEKIILPADVDINDRSINLSNLVDDVGIQMKRDLTDLLIDMVKAHLNYDSVVDNQCYQIEKHS
ncbi:MAG TPA: hypothetical protein H9841_12375 [Candidatus Flavonifractor merdigallinarum]|uniref:Uncharacterized protein n=1 Tax=Candidatus Flavonifractor merdigallinarum TaxID=2838589 RepID=A0A9D1YBA0_9FIRM|nr:hypothetical protein [Candidatus Flavonifractor merdigallinarum]